MVDEIRVRIIPGCPAVVVAETEEDREAAESALADTDCGVQVVTEDFVESLEAEEAPESIEYKGQQVPKMPVCSLEPDKPWEESVCGVVAKEAADDVLRQIRPQLERMERVSEEGSE